jgi:thiamine-monophosphate kinase
MRSRAMSEPTDEFAWIDSLRPLTLGDPRALDLADDAAAIPGRPGFDLIVSKDAMVSGVHTLADEAPDIVARRLLRTSLSDLAAKAAEPFGYLLMTAWPHELDGAWRAAFARGLAADGVLFKISLLGGDTVSTPGPLTLSATVLGWAPEGRAVKRSTARSGDLLMVCGVIGDGWLGLKAARSEIDDPGGALAARYRLPTPLLCLREALLTHARAAADVSDGLLADSDNIARASGLGLTIDLEDIPLSPEAQAWRAASGGQAGDLLALASGGDDYALVCAVDPRKAARFTAAVRSAGVQVAPVGRFRIDPGIEVLFHDEPVAARRLGWRHD